MEFEPKALKINERLTILPEEIHFTASRSGGPGGQNVNKVSTRITLWFDVLRSSSLSEAEKELILRTFPTRTNKNGWLWVTVQQTRSQLNNRELAKERFVELLQQALLKRSFRKKTRIPQRVREERLTQKKKQGELKMRRSSKGLGEWE
jgi:ribosome-associated protein